MGRVSGVLVLRRTRQRRVPGLDPRLCSQTGPGQMLGGIRAWIAVF